MEVQSCLLRGDVASLAVVGAVGSIDALVVLDSGVLEAGPDLLDGQWLVGLLR